MKKRRHWRKKLGIIVGTAGFLVDVLGPTIGVPPGVGSILAKLIIGLGVGTTAYGVAKDRDELHDAKVEGFQKAWGGE